MSRPAQAVVCSVLALALAGCPPPRPRVRQGEKGPPIPTDFVPGAPLGAEPTPDPSARGFAWLDSIHPRFHEKWADSFLEDARVYLPPTSPLNDGSLVVVIAFEVGPRGELASLAIAKSSGNDDFDQAALEVIRESAPFPAPPGDALSDDGHAYVEWLFARDSRQDGLRGARVDRRQWAPERAVPALLAAGRIADAAERVAVAAEGGGDAAALAELARQVVAAALEDALGGDDAAARVEAARALGRAKVTSVAERLRELATAAPDVALQAAAIEALGWIGDATAEKLMVEALERLDGERSAAAAGALARLGKGAAAWKALEPRLADKDARVRQAALATLAEAAEPSAVPALAKIFENKKAARSERAAAAAALGAAAAADGSGQAMKVLVAGLAAGDASLRAAAGWGLARAGEAGARSRAAYFKLEPLLKDKDPRVREAVAVAAAQLSPDGAGAELVLLVKKEKNAGVLAACARGLGAAKGEGVVAALLALAGSDQPEVRLAAIRALAARSEPEARAHVAGLAADEDVAVSTLAVATLEDPAALAGALESPIPEVRAAALGAWVTKAGLAATLPRALRLVGGAAAGRERVLLAAAFLGATP